MLRWLLLLLLLLKWLQLGIGLQQGHQVIHHGWSRSWLLRWGRHGWEGEYTVVVVIVIVVVVVIRVLWELLVKIVAVDVVVGGGKWSAGDAGEDIL